MPSRSTAALRGWVAITAVLLALTGCGGDDQDGSDDPNSRAASANPFAERAQTVVPPPRLTAAALQASADGDTDLSALITRLAEVPTGVWLTPEASPAGEVGPLVTSVLAKDQGATVPLFVIYGIPDRDCTGGFSAGGLTESTYLPWVQEIATAAGSRSAVVLEPDAIASTVECDNSDVRLRLLSGAVDALDAAGVTTYVDAGHSDWISPEQMAPLLTEVGVDEVRGFATNVANYQPLTLERSTPPT